MSSKCYHLGVLATKLSAPLCDNRGDDDKLHTAVVDFTQMTWKSKRPTIYFNKINCVFIKQDTELIWSHPASLLVSDRTVFDAEFKILLSPGDVKKRKEKAKTCLWIVNKYFYLSVAQSQSQEENPCFCSTVATHSHKSKLNGKGQSVALTADLPNLVKFTTKWGWCKMSSWGVCLC